MMAMPHRSKGLRVLPAPCQHGGYSRRVSSNTEILFGLTVEFLVFVFQSARTAVMINAPASAGLKAATSRGGGGVKTKPNRPRTGEGAFLRDVENE